MLHAGGSKKDCDLQNRTHKHTRQEAALLELTSSNAVVQRIIKSLTALLLTENICALLVSVSRKQSMGLRVEAAFGSVC